MERVKEELALGIDDDDFGVLTGEIWKEGEWEHYSLNEAMEVARRITVTNELLLCYYFGTRVKENETCEQFQHKMPRCPIELKLHGFAGIALQFINSRLSLLIRASASSLLPTVLRRQSNVLQMRSIASHFPVASFRGMPLRFSDASESVTSKVHELQCGGYTPIYML
ncbi:hypothetical protein PsorP6_001461 [Peronosclerospora sorghi]|uniref:Uncharacterized protein n=1 Tax=Peronosclerospora sorghi TaxID=230839 RepID=A0ACC0WYU6_9STRA|nr:hypothetical protein PsorP6_001461 [Peronosclerospora sorghi]